MNIELPLPLNTGIDVLVDAKLIFDCAPHLASVGTFALHEKPFHEGMWNVTHIETGCWAGTGSSRAAAIRNAKDRLRKQTPESFTKICRQAVRIHRLQGRI